MANDILQRILAGTYLGQPEEELPQAEVPMLPGLTRDTVGLPPMTIGQPPEIAESPLGPPSDMAPEPAPMPKMDRAQKLLSDFRSRRPASTSAPEPSEDEPKGPGFEDVLRRLYDKRAERSSNLGFSELAQKLGAHFTKQAGGTPIEMSDFYAQLRKQADQPVIAAKDVEKARQTKEDREAKEAEREAKKIDREASKKSRELSDQLRELQISSTKLGLGAKVDKDSPDSPISQSAAKLAQERYKDNPEVAAMFEGRSYDEVQDLLKMAKTKETLTAYQQFQIERHKEEMGYKKEGEARRQKQQKINLRQQQINTARGFLKDDPRYKKAVEQGMEFEAVDELIGQVEGGNEQAMAALGTKLARAMGEVGVLTDTDVVRYISGTSWGRKLQDWFEKGATGTPSEQTLKEIGKNLKVLKTKLKGDVSRVYDNAEKRMKVAYPDLDDGVIRGVLGNISYREEAAPKKQDVSKKIDQAKKWLEKNPDDPNAEAVKQRIKMMESQ